MILGSVRAAVLAHPVNSTLPDRLWTAFVDERLGRSILELVDLHVGQVVVESPSVGGGHHDLAVDARRLAASVDLGHPPQAHQRIGTRPKLTEPPFLEFPRMAESESTACPRPAKVAVCAASICQDSSTGPQRYAIPNRSPANSSGPEPASRATY